MDRDDLLGSERLLWLSSFCSVCMYSILCLQLTIQRMALSIIEVIFKFLW